MRKIILTIASLFVATFITTLIFSKLLSASAPDTGTCCYRMHQICVVGTVSHYEHYYLKEGPCP